LGGLLPIRYQHATSPRSGVGGCRFVATNMRPLRGRVLGDAGSLLPTCDLSEVGRWAACCQFATNGRPLRGRMSGVSVRCYQFATSPRSGVGGCRFVATNLRPLRGRALGGLLPIRYQWATSPRSDVGGVGSLLPICDLSEVGCRGCRFVATNLRPLRGRALGGLLPIRYQWATSPRSFSPLKKITRPGALF